ncbi:RBM43 protein, partial [Alcedo cyanopectus]|nr:RBM43 protein [Ceyx cyanopectus]
VFSSVTSVINMSIFKDQFVLEELIQEIEKKSTALSFGPLQSNGHVSVQGSFPAIKLLREFLLAKAKSLSEEDKREESKTHQRPRRKLQQHRLATEMSNSTRDADGGKQVVVLDTDVYHYMKHFFPRTLLMKNDVAISDVVDKDTTTLYIQKAGRGPAADQVLRVKEKIESQSVKLHNTLRKERIYFEGRRRDEKKRYTWVCEHLKSQYPSLLTIPYDTHIDVIGNSSEVFQFTKAVKN